MENEWSDTVLDPMTRMIDAWCERRELKALAIVLPASVNNFGVTDGWAAVLEAFRDLRSRTWLPNDERLVVERVATVVEDALIDRG